MKQFNKLFSALSAKPLMLLSLFALLPTIASAQCPDNNHPHMIDLGLPSGTKWACCNVGASKPEDYGDYYAWGETKPKSIYMISNYMNGKGQSYNIGKDIAGTQYDAATANWGSLWVMPNFEQTEELHRKCTSEWTTENGVNGRRFTGPNGASIFLPAAGYHWYGNSQHKGLRFAGSKGHYWTSKCEYRKSISFSGEISQTSSAWMLIIESSHVSSSNIYSRVEGRSVRPVLK